jgi:hypothetical protein
LNCVRGVIQHNVTQHNEIGTAEREARDVIQIVLLQGAENFENQMRIQGHPNTRDKPWCFM